MKLASKEAKAILAKIEGLKLGQQVQFDGFLHGFGKPVDAFLTEIEDGRFWQFALYWNSVHLQDVVVEKIPNELIVDVLGA
jgi:hypothetical protein